MFQTRTLVGRYNVRCVLKCATTVHDRPPVHWFCRTPWIHVSGDANQDFGSVCRYLADCFGKYPVVTDGATNATNRRIGDGKQRFVIAFDVVGTRMNFEWNPGIDLTILV